MSENTTNVTDLVTPEPSSAAKAKKVLIVATAVTLGAFAAIKGLEKLRASKTVEVTVVDNDNN